MSQGIRCGRRAALPCDSGVVSAKHRNNNAANGVMQRIQRWVQQRKISGHVRVIIHWQEAQVNGFSGIGHAISRVITRPFQ